MAKYIAFVKAGKRGMRWLGLSVSLGSDRFDLKWCAVGFKPWNRGLRVTHLIAFSPEDF